MCYPSAGARFWCALIYTCAFPCLFSIRPSFNWSVRLSFRLPFFGSTTHVRLVAVVIVTSFSFCVSCSAYILLEGSILCRDTGEHERTLNFQSVLGLPSQTLWARVLCTRPSLLTRACVFKSWNNTPLE